LKKILRFANSKNEFFSRAKKGNLCFGHADSQDQKMDSFKENYYFFSFFTKGFIFWPFELWIHKTICTMFHWTCHRTSITNPIDFDKTAAQIYMFKCVTNGTKYIDNTTKSPWICSLQGKHLNTTTYLFAWEGITYIICS
jgi:hypothetical protein